MSDEIDEEIKVRDQGDQTYLVLVFIVFLIILYFLIINSFADQCSTDDVICTEGLNQWYVFVFRFQTLIGGALAIVAAFITVWQMRLNDAEAEKRNRKVLRAMDREYYEGCVTLQRFSSHALLTPPFAIKDELEKLSKYAASNDTFWDAFRISHNFYDRFKEIKNFLEDQIWCPLSYNSAQWHFD